MEKSFRESLKGIMIISRTMCAINKPLWKYYPNLKNLEYLGTNT